MASIADATAAGQREQPGPGEAGAAGQSPDGAWPGHGIGALADHIIETHHAFLREQFPRLIAMLERTMAEDDNRFAELWSLRDLLKALRASVESGTTKEEQVLFPLIHQLDRACRRGDRPPESVAGYLRDLSHDHRIAAVTLGDLEEITRHYTVPDGASGAFRELIAELARLREDLRVHNEKEDALIERAIAAERELLHDRADPSRVAS